MRCANVCGIKEEEAPPGDGILLNQDIGLWLLNSTKRDDSVTCVVSEARAA